MAQVDSRRKALAGLFGGVLAIPALALVSSALLGPTDPEAAAAPAEAPTQAEATSTTAQAATAGDLRRACGRDGKALVEAEAAGTIGEVEQAALDALRPICEAEGRPLSDPLAPEAVVVTASQRSDVTTVSFDDDHDDDHDDDGTDDTASWDTPDTPDDTWDTPDDSWDD